MASFNNKYLHLLVNHYNISKGKLLVYSPYSHIVSSFSLRNNLDIFNISQYKIIGT